jgi:hypothetical protein
MYYRNTSRSYYFTVSTCCDAGYTPQSLLPLYVRNTQIEKNGTTPGGDQCQAVMATDRRYSHYIGRPLNRFEPGKDLLSLSTTNVNEFGLKTNPLLPPVKELTEKQKQKLLRRKKEILNHPISSAFVRLEFEKLPSLSDL